jgi:hypothetical protein
MKRSVDAITATGNVRLAPTRGLAPNRRLEISDRPRSRLRPARSRMKRQRNAGTTLLTPRASAGDGLRPRKALQQLQQVEPDCEDSLAGLKRAD